jgi:hypothetical protein
MVALYLENWNGKKKERHGYFLVATFQHHAPFRQLITHFNWSQAEEMFGGEIKIPILITQIN